MPVSLNGEIDAGEKDLGLKTSDLGLTSAAGLRKACEAATQASGVGFMAASESSEVLSPMSFLSLAS